MITVPEGFAADTVTREGDAGRAWVAALPAAVEALCARWGLVVDGAVMHGYLGVVVPALRGGEPCALKVSWVDEATAEEAAALTAWGGRGAVRLLDALPEQGALLLERLDPARRLSGLPVAEAVAVAGGLLRRLAIPAPAGVRRLPDVAAELARGLPERWERAGRPVPRRAVEQAAEAADALGAAAGGLLVNYDLHYDDVLGGEREPWLAVDPKVVAGDPEFGAAQLLWTRLEDMEAGGGLARHLAALVEAAELDAERTRAWTVARCVDYWLWALGVGLTIDPARCARIVELLA